MGDGGGWVGGLGWCVVNGCGWKSSVRCSAVCCICCVCVCVVQQCVCESAEGFAQGTTSEQASARAFGMDGRKGGGGHLEIGGWVNDGWMGSGLLCVCCRVFAVDGRVYSIFERGGQVTGNNSRHLFKY